MTNTVESLMDQLEIAEKKIARLHGQNQNQRKLIEGLEAAKISWWRMADVFKAQAIVAETEIDRLREVIYRRSQEAPRCQPPMDSRL